MVQLEGSLQRAKNRKCASCKNLFKEFNRHLDLGTSVLTNGSRHLDLSNVLINLVYTRDAAETWWCFLVIHEDDIPIVGNNDRKIVTSK